MKKNSLKKIGLSLGLVLFVALSLIGSVHAETIYNYNATPVATLFWFIVLIIVLIAGAAISYAFFPLLGVAFGVVGIIGVAFFEQAGSIIISQYTDVNTGITYASLMPLGLYVIAPLMLCILNFVLPLVKRRA